MKFITRISLLAILLSAVLSLNIFAQSENAERLDVKSFTRVNTSDDKTITNKESSPNADELIAATTYAFSSSAAVALEDMSSGTTTLVGASQDDTASAVTSIGFEFWFDGVRQTQFSANANGLMRLGATVVDSGATGRTNNFADGNNEPKISAYWDDMCTSAAGKVHFKVLGAPGSRKLVVEFQNMVTFGATSCTDGLAIGTYQVWLFESVNPTTPGAVQFVYGALGANSAANGGYSNGMSSSTTSFASITTATDTVSYAASSNAQINAIATGKSYSFTPNIPAAPTGLTFGVSTATTVTLNWTDASANEFGFLVYRSLDGITYTLVTQTAANVITYTDTGRTPSTNYFYRVYSVSEGALSTTFISGSQSTVAAGNDTCSGTPTNWTTPASWADGSVPTSGDNVIIQAGCTLLVDTTTPTAINLTVQSGGTLRYHPTTASTLTLIGDATVDAGGTFDAGTGTLLTHILNIGGNTSASGAAGNLTVNGVFDMNTTAGVTTNFFGSANGTLSGAGATADFFTIVGQKGATQAAILDVTRVITISTPAASGSRLTVNGGTIKISSATVATPWFGSNTITGANGRLWINNAGASLQSVGAGTSATGAGSPTFTGGLQIDAGLFAYGQGNNAMSVSGSVVMNGGTLNMFGSFTFAANSTLTMTAGNINIDPQNVTSLAAANNILRFTGPNTVSFTGGTITIVDPHAATGAGRALSISTNVTTYNFVGGTIRFGDGVSSTAGSVDGFDIDTFVAGAQPLLGTVVVDNPVANAATRFVRVNTAAAPFQILLTNLTVTGTGGSEFRLNGNLTAVAGNVLNNGVINGNTTSSSLYFFGVTPQTFSGTGVTGTVALPMLALSFDSTGGVTFDPALTNNVITKRINLFTGNVFNSGKMTLGNNNATLNTVQIGNTTTPTAAGTFDAPLTFDLGTGGETIIYLRTNGNRTTGGEVNPARALVGLTYDDNVAGRTLTLAGGNLTVSGALALTNGVIVTSTANTLIHNGAATRTTGFVDGPLMRDFAVAPVTAYTFFVGEGVFSPVGLANITAAGSTLTAESLNATLTPFPPANAISRNWTLTKSVAGTLTADVSFTYDQVDDVPGTANEADFRLFRRDTGAQTEVCGTACVDETTNVATITGLSSFSRWTVAEALAPTAANINIAGRVMMPDGVTGFPRARVVLTGGGLTAPRTITTGPFGYYSFDGLPAGQTYVLTVGAKQFTFATSSIVITPSDNVQNADFIAMPPNANPVTNEPGVDSITKP